MMLQMLMINLKKHETFQDPEKGDYDILKEGLRDCVPGPLRISGRNVVDINYYKDIKSKDKDCFNSVGD